MTSQAAEAGWTLRTLTCIWTLEGWWRGDLGPKAGEKVGDRNTITRCLVRLKLQCEMAALCPGGHAGTQGRTLVQAAVAESASRATSGTAGPGRTRPAGPRSEPRSRW